MAHRPGGIGANRVRIVGGSARSRVLRFSARPGLRPTPDRVRETLFNWLDQDLSGMDCLDAFAGSGALGFEAASRGARRCVLVERDRAAHADLVRNAALLALPGVELHCDDGLEFARRERRRFDLVFLDPPFGSGLMERMLPLLPGLLRPGAQVYAETPAGFVPGEPWVVRREARAGQVHYRLLTASGNE